MFRGDVLGTNGMVASSQTLASTVGANTLMRGGNAADAAVAMAAVLNLAEPCSTGVGGDCFILYYDAKSREVSALLGNGRSPSKLTLDHVEAHGFSKSNPFDQFHPFSVTVPGAVAGWCDAVERFGSGKLSMMDILTPAIDMATKGVPIGRITSNSWKSVEPILQRVKNGRDLLIYDKAPEHGQVFRNVLLADTFKEIGEKGKDGFYRGRIAEAIVKAIEEKGGNMTLEDLHSHTSTFCSPISTSYRGIDIYEIPLPTHGAVVLSTLNILENFSLRDMGHNSPTYLHHLIEALRLSFADAAVHICDPSVVQVPQATLLSKEYAAARKSLILPDKANPKYASGVPSSSSDTVQFTAVDANGNACSMINSNYCGFGSFIIPDNSGFSLQNRGSNFSLQRGHANCIAPRKRPYHTIIPGMAIKNSELWCAFGVMGGFMQPQGHVQVLCNMIDFDMSPQQALDAARICLPAPISEDKSAVVMIEDGISAEVMGSLGSMGHKVAGPLCGFERSLFGRGQIIRRDATGVLFGGSDIRADGCACGW